MANKIAAVLMAILVISMSLAGCAKKDSTEVQGVSEPKEEVNGKLLVRVTDKSSKEPLGDATIVVMDVDSIYKTNEIGLSPEIELKVNKDMYMKYGEGLFSKAPSGCATVLITKEGYKDHMVYNKAIFPGSGPNVLRVEMTELSKDDKQGYEIEMDSPHEAWVQELLQYCANIEDENSGIGDRTVTISVTDSKSKSLEGVTVVIPELNIKASTDKKGECILSPSVIVSEEDDTDAESTGNEENAYTIVVIKEDYKPSILFNVSVENIKDNSIQISLKKMSADNDDEYMVSHYPLENEWVEKVISSYKEGTE